LVLYTFDEGHGDAIRDRSGRGEPLDLRIPNAAHVQWLPAGGLGIHSPTLLSSSVPARKIVTAAQASGALTIEAWIKPANVGQAGPARIATLSRDTSERNFTLGQDHATFQVRLRTTRTSANGEPALDSPGGLDPARFIAAARSQQGDVAILYFPVGGETALQLDRLAPGLESHWFDPRTGQRSPAHAAELHRFRTPDEQDWVLLLTAPGSTSR
jgi:hypothetical protein